MKTTTIAADFSLPGIDGRTCSLDSFKDAKALVIVFSCNHCPYVQAYEGRLVQLQKEYAAKGVRLVAINSNDAKAYGATHTPHLFVFGPDRKLAYTGKIDDDWQQPANVKKQYLREALDDLLAGRPVREPETHAIGCTIKWKR